MTGQFKTTIAENGIFRFVFILPEKLLTYKNLCFSNDAK